MLFPTLENAGQISEFYQGRLDKPLGAPNLRVHPLSPSAVSIVCPTLSLREKEPLLKNLLSSVSRWKTLSQMNGFEHAVTQ